MENFVTSEWVLEFLSEEGFKGKADEDGDISFKYEGATYLCIFDSDDPGFIRLAYPVDFDNPHHISQNDMYGILMKVMESTKLGKIVLIKANENEIGLAYKIEFIGDRKIFADNFERFIDILRLMVKKTRDLLFNIKE